LKVECGRRKELKAISSRLKVKNSPRRSLPPASPSCRLYEPEAIGKAYAPVVERREKIKTERKIIDHRRVS
jgi:hypothetical protein